MIALKKSYTKLQYPKDGISASLNDLLALKQHVLACRYRVKPKKDYGMRANKLKGQGMDFAEVRHYQAGDELRHMEWRTTAKTGKPHVKLYEEDRQNTVSLLVDFNESMYFGTKVAFKSLTAAMLASLIIWQQQSSKHTIGLVTFNSRNYDKFSHSTKLAALTAMLQHLSTYTQNIPNNEINPSGTSNIISALNLLNPKAQDKIIMISDCYNLTQDDEYIIKKYSLNNKLALYHIIDPLERRLAYGAYAVQHHQDNIMLNKSLIKSYNNYKIQELSDIKILCQKHKIFYQQISQTDDLLDILNKMV
jgi:uncharacterized protein (DUF58 family)